MGDKLTIKAEDFPLNKIAQNWYDNYLIPLKEKIDKNKANFDKLGDGHKEVLKKLEKDYDFYLNLYNEILNLILLHSLTIGALSKFIINEGNIIFNKGEDLDPTDPLQVFSVNTIVKEKFMDLKELVEVNLKETKNKEYILLQKKFTLEAINIIEVKKINNN